MSDDLAIELTDVAKTFRKTARRKESTTLKTEFVRLLTGQGEAPRREEHAEEIVALHGVNLAIPRGKTVGVIGRNGSGKSTLLKLLTGIYTPTRGTVVVRGRVSALLELGAGFHPDFTGRENILINGIILGMSRSQVKARMEEIIEFAELGPFIDEPVRTYSSGMFMRLAFAVATHVDPDVLIIDEILSVGDEHFARKSKATMERFRTGGRTMVLVTHDLGTVEAWCDLAAWLDGGTVREYGPPADVVRAYRRAVAAAEAEAATTGHSALSEPGLALPAVPGSPLVKPGQVDPVTATPPAARLTGVHAPPGPLAPGAPLELILDYQVDRPRSCAFVVELRTADGVVLFSTRFEGAGAGVTGSARLEFPSPGLAPGTYRVHARVMAGEDGSDELSVPLTIAPGEAAALPCPPHQWSILGPSA